MKNTRIALKNIEFSERLSEETNNFAADIYLDGKKIGYARNQGHGGSTDYHWNEGCREKIEEAEAYAKSLPAIVVSPTFTLEMNLEHLIDQLMEDWLKAKEQKKLAKNFEKGLCVGKPHHYEIIGWKGHTISSILRHPQGMDILKKAIEKVKAEGKEIMNTNLPKELIG